LLFVALTRAKHNIYISYPRIDYQNKEQRLLSFLREQKGIQEIPTGEFEKTVSVPVTHFVAESQQVELSLLDPEYIRKRFLTRGLSVSALNNFIASPVLYFFRNLVLLPEAMSDVLEFGNCIHKVLEEYFKQAQQEKSVGNKEALFDTYTRVLEEIPRWSKYKEQATETLSEYYEYYRESMSIPLEIEYGVFGLEFPLQKREETILLSGRIDKIEKREDGSLVVVDYKTGKSFSEKKGKNKEDTQIKKDAITRQAVFYALLLEHYRGGIYKTRTVVFDFVQKNKKGEFERYEVVVTDEQLDNLKQEIEQMAESVLSGSFISDLYNTDDLDDSYKELFEILMIR